MSAKLFFTAAVYKPEVRDLLFCPAATVLNSSLACLLLSFAAKMATAGKVSKGTHSCDFFCISFFFVHEGRLSHDDLHACVFMYNVHLCCVQADSEAGVKGVTEF